jgi:hypothetical protein
MVLASKQRQHHHDGGGDTADLQDRRGRSAVTIWSMSSPWVESISAPCTRGRQRPLHRHATETITSPRLVDAHHAALLALRARARPP